VMCHSFLIWCVGASVLGSSSVIFYGHGVTRTIYNFCYRSVMSNNLSIYFNVTKT
jgi:hypothetical protein